MGWLTEEELQKHPSDIERALNRDALREDEGHAAPCGVYTLPEMAALTQSVVQGQRMAGLRLLRQIDHHCRLGASTPLRLPDSIPSDITSLTWNDVRAFVLLELNAVALLRGALVGTPPAVSLAALEILAEICRGKHPADQNRSDVADQWLPFCTSVPPPLERLQPSYPWHAALSGEPPSFRRVLGRELESGCVEDVRSVIGSATLPTVLQLVTSLCLRGAELAERLSHDILLLIRLRTAVAEQPDFKTRLPFLQCLCTWSAVLPTALPLLKSHGTSSPYRRLARRHSVRRVAGDGTVRCPALDGASRHSGCRLGRAGALGMLLSSLARRLVSRRGLSLDGRSVSDLLSTLVDADSTP